MNLGPDSAPETTDFRPRGARACQCGPVHGSAEMNLSPDSAPAPPPGEGVEGSVEGIALRRPVYRSGTDLHWGSPWVLSRSRFLPSGRRNERAGAAHDRCARNHRSARVAVTLLAPIEGMNLAHERSRSVNFIALQVSLQFIETLRDPVAKLAQHDSSLADQIRRAASSVALNLGEVARGKPAEEGSMR